MDKIPVGHKTSMGFHNRLSVIGQAKGAKTEAKEKLRKTPDPNRPLFKVNSMSMLNQAAT